MTSHTAEGLREKLARKLAANPGIKTALLADALGCREADLFAVWPDDTVRRLDPTRSEEIIRSLEAMGPLYVVVRNPTCVMEVTGAFGGFSQSGPWFNVATENLHLHIQLGGIQSAYLRIAPGPGGSPSASAQFFDTAGESCLKAFAFGAEKAESLEKLLQPFLTSHA
jgi:putative heme degradation protein